MFSRRRLGRNVAWRINPGREELTQGHRGTEQQVLLTLPKCLSMRIPFLASNQVLKEQSLASAGAWRPRARRRPDYTQGFPERTVREAAADSFVHYKSWLGLS